MMAQTDHYVRMINILWMQKMFWRYSSQAEWMAFWSLNSLWSQTCGSSVMVGRFGVVGPLLPSPRTLRLEMDQTSLSSAQDRWAGWGEKPDWGYSEDTRGERSHHYKGACRGGASSWVTENTLHGESSEKRGFQRIHWTSGESMTEKVMQLTAKPACACWPWGLYFHHNTPVTMVAI